MRMRRRQIMDIERDFDRKGREGRKEEELTAQRRT
jgi:hypothetical protein